MLNAIKTHVLGPLFSRVGTASATVLIGYGFQADVSHATGAFVAAGAGIIFDLIADYVRLRKGRQS